jgi:hypothetical protein
MIYASSKQSLKIGFGTSMCVDADVHATDKSDCTAEAYLSSFDDFNPELLMTRNELEAYQAEAQSQMSAGQGPTKISTEIPVNVHDDVLPSLQAFVSGEATCVVLDINTKREIIKHIHTGNETALSQLLEYMPDRQARYIVYKHNYSHDDQKKSQNLFFFFCHENCKPRNKMIYATVKSKVLSLCRQSQIQNIKTFELSDTADLSERDIYLDLHPPAVKDKSFAKPKAKRSGKSGGRRKMHGKVKFQARR